MICDICSTEVTSDTACYLTTRQVVLSENYWVSVRERFGAAAGVPTDALRSIVAQAAAQRHPWAVCPRCAVMFEFDVDVARSCASRGESPPGGGPVDVEQAYQVFDRTHRRPAGSRSSTGVAARRPHAPGPTPAPRPADRRGSRRGLRVVTVLGLVCLVVIAVFVVARTPGAPPPTEPPEPAGPPVVNVPAVAIPGGSGGQHPDVALSPDGSRAYGTDDRNASVSVVDTASDRIVGLITFGGSANPSNGDYPNAVAVSPDGRRVYTANGTDARNRTSSVSIIDAATNTIVRTVPLSPSTNTASDVATSPDGERVYVLTYDSGLWVLDSSGARPRRIGSAGVGPDDLTLSADGTRAYVVNNGEGTLTVFDTTAPDHGTARVPIGITPTSTAIAGDGRRAFVTTENVGAVALVDLQQNRTTGVVATAGSPDDVALSRDGRRALVTDRWRNSVSVIDVASNLAVARLALPGALGATAGATGLAVGGDGRAYVATRGGLVVLGVG